jgi:dihydroneopterin aldolase
MDKIFLRELTVDTVVGIWEWERRIKQTVSIDLEMATDARAAAAEDSIAGTLNYKDVAKRLIGFVGGAQFQLVESLAEAIASIVVEEFGVRWVRVSVAKPGAIEGSRVVGIILERTADDYGG